MAVESIAATAAAPPPRVSELGPAVSPEPTPQASGDLAGRFDTALTHAVGGAGEVPPALRDMIGMLDKVNGEAKSVAEYAKSAELSGSELTPGEVVQLSMRCQEFMFHCQLTSNIANRSSEGVQQLFKQQG